MKDALICSSLPRLFEIRSKFCFLIFLGWKYKSIPSRMNDQRKNMWNKIQDYSMGIPQALCDTVMDETITLLVSNKAE